MDKDKFAKNIQATLDWLKAGAPHVRIGKRDNVGFNMSFYIGDTDEYEEYHDQTGNYCGTACCIAGHVTLAYDLKINSRWNRAHEMAADHLGLDVREADQLFMGEYYDAELGINTNMDLERVTPEMAVAVIENAIKTGKIDWSIVA